MSEVKDYTKNEWELMQLRSEYAKHPCTVQLTLLDDVSTGVALINLIDQALNIGTASHSAGGSNTRECVRALESVLARNRDYLEDELKRESKSCQ